MKNVSLFILIFMIAMSITAQMPGAITIDPPDATAYDELTLIFDPEESCFQLGCLTGLDSIAMHSGVTFQNGLPWQKIVEFDSLGINGQKPILMPTGDGRYSITFNPSEFYGLNGEVVSQICAVFNNGTNWQEDGRDYRPDSLECMDFFIPLEYPEPCLPQGIEFVNQSMIDNFQMNYPECTQILGDVTINGSNISNLNGLLGISSIEGNVWITQNSSLISLSGLDSLQMIGGYLIISNNLLLSDLNGLNKLNSIGSSGLLQIVYNAGLISLTGIESLDPESIHSIQIYDNYNLSECAIQNICDFLDDPPGEVFLFQNGPGCNNPSEVAAGCGITLSCLPYGHYYFFHQEEVDSFQVNYPACNDLAGKVSIWDSEIENLNGLNNITSIEKELYFLGTELNTLAGLESLVSVGGILMFSGNSNMESFSGLDNLQHVGALRLESTSVPNLEGLNSLTTIGGKLTIRFNNFLSNLNGLENVSSIGGDLSIYNNILLSDISGIGNISANSIPYMYIYENSSLSDCAVKSVCDYLAIPGGYAGIYDNADGCNSVIQVEEACESVSVGEENLYECILLYPNPARQELNISVKGSTIEEVSIYSITGQKILQAGPVNGSIDISKLRSGMYVVEVGVENMSFRQKLLVE